MNVKCRPETKLAAITEIIPVFKESIQKIWLEQALRTCATLCLVLMIVGCDTSEPWRIHRVENPLDGSTMTLAVLSASSGPKFDGKKVALYVGCNNGLTLLQINWQTPVSDQEIDVTTQIDDQEPLIERWGIGPSGKMTPRIGTIAFLQRLLKSDRLRATITTKKKETISVEFDVSGIVRGLKPMVETCQWELPFEERDKFTS